jgi:hypothetical protein
LYAGLRTGLMVRPTRRPLVIGDLRIECAVLADGTRLISERAFSKAIKLIRGGAEYRRRKAAGEGHLPIFLTPASLRPFVDDDLRVAAQTIDYIPKSTGRAAKGIKANVIPAVCNAWLKARDARALKKRQLVTAFAADIIMRGIATVGIIALVDEATGYEDVRPKNALAKILEEFVAKELRQWVSTFPTSFFRELCRLRSVPFREDMRLPRYFGHLVNDLIYSRLAPGVLDELKRKNPSQENGRRKDNHTQWLTKEIGHPKLLYHIGRLEGIAEDFGQSNKRSERSGYHQFFR